MKMQEIGIGLLIGIILGSVGLYSINTQRIGQLNSKIHELENDEILLEFNTLILDCLENSNEIKNSTETLQIKLDEEKEAKDGLAQLQKDYISLDEDYVMQQGIFNELENSTNRLYEEFEILQVECESFDELKEINVTYHHVIETLNLIDVKNQTQILEYSQPVGSNVIYSFHMRYNVTLDIEISNSGSYISIALSWRKGDLTGFIGSSGRPVSESKPTLEGTIRATYFDADATSMWVRGAVITNYPHVQRTGEVLLGVP